jgi:hypothetical protein
MSQSATFEGPTEGFRETRPVTFNLAELWLLNAMVRHDISQYNEWKYPPASLQLAVSVAEAIHTCEEYKVPEYTLLLSKGDLLVIDYNIQADMKTPEGAQGRLILLKVFKAISELDDTLPASLERDETYNQAVKRSGKELKDASSDKPD